LENLLVNLRQPKLVIDIDLSYDLSYKLSHTFRQHFMKLQCNKTTQKLFLQTQASPGQYAHPTHFPRSHAWRNRRILSCQPGPATHIYAILSYKGNSGVQHPQVNNKKGSEEKCDVTHETNSGKKLVRAGVYCRHNERIMKA
jgi:hypothetical protein